MDGLRDRMTALGLEHVRTLLNSGNVVFHSELRGRDELERRIEDEIARNFGQPTDCFVRSGAEWADVISRNPFPQQAEEDPSLLTALILKQRRPAKAWDDLRSSVTGPEAVSGDSDHGYVVYPEGQGRSRLTPARLERALGTRGTIRNWNTVRKIDALLRD
jgi:uncharacterized protein (DUF1697 family)